MQIKHFFKLQNIFLITPFFFEKFAGFMCVIFKAAVLIAAPSFRKIATISPQNLGKCDCRKINF